MRKIKLTVTLLLLLAFSLPVFAAFNPAYSDYLFYNKGAFHEDMEYLEKALKDASSDSEKAEIIWRMSRTQLTITDDFVSADNKDLRLTEYMKSWELAQQSIDIMPTFNAYHWLASAMGRWGQTKGPLNALGKAGEMRSYACKVQDEFKADNSDTWYVLGVLYRSVPSGLSFGNDNFAISYMRRCLDTQDTVNRLNLTNYLELANELLNRNWDASKRAKEIAKMQKKYQKETVPSEMMKYYEGKDGAKGKPYYSSVTLDKMSDAQEALMLLRYAEAIYNLYPEHKPGDTRNYEKIMARIGDIT